MNNCSLCSNVIQSYEQMIIINNDNNYMKYHMNCYKEWRYNEDQKIDDQEKFKYDNFVDKYPLFINENTKLLNKVNNNSNKKCYIIVILLFFIVFGGCSWITSCLILNKRGLTNSSLCLNSV